MPDEMSYRSRRRFLKGGMSLWIVGGLGVTTWKTAALAAPIPYGGDKGQKNWRGCNKCSGLFYDGVPQKGRCPAGGGHVAQGFNFELPFNTPAERDTQDNWRFCNKCSGMFYDGFSKTGTWGTCPAGGSHVAQGYNFVLHHDTAAGAIAQNNWRACNKCSGMFYDGFSKTGTWGTCPAGGSHVAQGYNFVLTHDAHDSQPADSGGGSISTPQLKYCAASCDTCTKNNLGCSPADIRCPNVIEAPAGCY